MTYEEMLRLIEAGQIPPDQIPPEFWDYTRAPLPEELGPVAPGPSPDQTPPPGMLPYTLEDQGPDYTRGILDYKYLEPNKRGKKKRGGRGAM